MARGKSNNSIDQFVDMIIDLTNMFWQVGLAVSVIFISLGFYSLDWALVKNNPIDPTTIDAVVSTSIGWFFYSIPTLLFGLGIMAAWRTYISYTKQNRF